MNTITITLTTTSSSIPLLTHQSSATIFSHLCPSSTNPISSLSSILPLHISCSRYPKSRTFRTHNSFFNFSTGDDDDDDDDDFGRKRRGRRRRRQWWSEYSPAEMDQEPGILEEFIDSIWIFKVFGSYGWLLPAIVISLLLTTGPKAFLMALALPIGQSTLTLAFKKLKGITQNNPKRKTKTKKSQRANTVSDVELEEEDEEESGGTRKVARGYQSWLSRDDASTFGGWDELDRLKEFDMGSSRRSARTGRSGRTRTEKGKFSGRVRKSDMPLLLRLLIAVFPFLGSWTRML
ncbi:hypothetical protein TEA_007693 [Camellia sinensis var. sinensis]|uniref:Uncharacterized protein n=1 Tax=Camellia sinensis var. sinensis TaxID=542762 RepID=A0A4S4EYE0_CAMSN|nr:hypothetical protein TEA_007693 [Camellia sinensis var. sinensis]